VHFGELYSLAKLESQAIKSRHSPLAQILLITSVDAQQTG